MFTALHAPLQRDPEMVEFPEEEPDLHTPSDATTSLLRKTSPRIFRLHIRNEEPVQSPDEDLDMDAVV